MNDKNSFTVIARGFCGRQLRRSCILVLALLIVSCSKQQEKEAPPAQRATKVLGEKFDLEKAIALTPPDLVSTTAPLEIRFREHVVPQHLKDTVLDKNPFSFDPAIEGHAVWVSSKILRFVPSTRLPAGQQVNGTLHGKVAFGEQRDVADFRFSFKVAEQEILRLSADFLPTDTKNVVTYSGTITFAEPVDVAKISNDLVFKGPRGAVDVQVTQAEKKEQIVLTSAKLTRLDKGQSFTISLPGQYTANRKKWEQAVFLPGINVFRVLADMDMTEPDADRLSYGFRFNEPVADDIDLSGFVSIETDIPYEVRVQGKYLVIDGDFVPGAEYAATISQGFPSTFGMKLTDNYRKSFAFDNIKPDVEWLDDGVYLPTDNNFKLQLKSVNVARLRIIITEIFADNAGFFIQSNRLIGQAKPRGPYDRFQYQDLSRVGEQIYNEQHDIDSDLNKSIKTEIDLSSAFKEKENTLFVIQLTFDNNDLVGRCVNKREDLETGDLFYDQSNYYENPCQGGYYYSRHKSKLLISSDVALTVKRAADGLHVFAINVLDAHPISGLDLGLYSYQNQLLERKSTDRDGHALFTEKGTYVYGTHSSGVALIQQNHPTWEINNFDVAGGVGGRKGVDVFMYADRDVHRPGDTVHLSTIIRMDRGVPPDKQPVILKVRDPKNQVVHEAREPSGANGLVYFPIETDLSDPTGTWRAELTIGDQTFSKALRIETVKPNRLKVNVELPEQVRGPVPTLTADINAKYLFGAPAANLRARVEAGLSPLAFSADGFDGFTFDTPLKRFQPRSEVAFDGKLTADGTINFKHKIRNTQTAPSLIRATINTTVFETGGSFTKHATRTTVYPFDSFVGVKDVFQWSGARTGENYSVPIVALNADGEPVAGRKLKVAVYVNRRHWWWHYDQRDRKDFRKMEATYLIGEYDYVSQGAPITHQLSVEDRGRHLIQVTDVASGHEAGLFFNASRWGRGPAAAEEEQNFLQIVSDKNVYSVGDIATVTFDTPANATALFTVEQGDRIIHREWREANSERTSFEFSITGDLVPNCYASVSVMQPHNQNTNDLPMRLYGIKTIYAEEPSTRLPLEIRAPAEVKPKETFTIDVTSQAAERASYTIAIVDDGLLDLTSFATPSPWDHYFQKIRLGVVTTDNFDQIIGVLYPDIDRYLSIGGGLLAEEQKKRVDSSRVQRFKPVVLFKEPITIEPGETVSTTFTMPNYVGSVRAMVVGAAGNSYVSLEETVPVRQPLMILPTVPRVVRPGDTFALPVSVFATKEDIRDVSLSLSLSDNLSAHNSDRASTTFTKTGERDVAFTVAVGDAVGASTVTVNASGGSYSADYTVELPVSSPNPFFTEVTDTAAVKGQPLTLVPRKFGLEGTNSARIAFTRLPDIQIEKRLADLINYPYGCIEQTISAAFPQLFLEQLADLKPHQKQATTDHINAAIEKLARFQMKGGFSFWPTSSNYRPRWSDWGTAYAGHFLVAAKELGYHIPNELYSHWLSAAKKKAKHIKKDNHRYQTYRLFVLAIAGESQIGAMNLVRENHLAALDPLSRKLLAAAYYLAGEKSIAVEIERATPTEIADYRELSGTYGSALRDRALITYAAVLMDDLRTAAQLLQGIADDFRPWGWYSTQETAMALLATGAYQKASPFVGGDVTFRLTIGSAKQQTLTLDGYRMTVDLDNAWGENITVENDSSNPLFVALFEEGVPRDNRIKTEHNGIQLTRDFYNEQGQPIDVSKRQQGQPFWVVYGVRSTHRAALPDLALSSIFPAGWEIVSTRLVSGDLPPWIRNLKTTSGEYMDVRDDRVNWFFSLRQDQFAKFAVKINPTFKGTYVQPPIVVESMYSPEFYGRIAGGAVRVE